MRNKSVKMSLEDIYNGVSESMESKKSELVSLLEDITEPICPQSGEKFQFLGKSGGENRSLRFKWVCPKSVPVHKTGSRVCTCGTPCTDSTMKNVFTPIPTRLFVFIRAFREIRSIGILSTSTVSLRKEALTC